VRFNALPVAGAMTMLAFIPFGIDRLPRDPRLRCVEVGAAPLRLNSESVPADAMPLATGDHAARVAAAVGWLEAQCGDYAPLRRQFITTYFRVLAARVEARREELAARLKPYDGLYAPEDYLWSALRPLPRGWVPVGDGYLPADVVFWDGERATAIELGARDTERHRALLAAGVAAHRIEPTTLPDELLPMPPFETLPSSPFRRRVPDFG